MYRRSEDETLRSSGIANSHRIEQVYILTPYHVLVCDPMVQNGTLAEAE